MRPTGEMTHPEIHKGTSWKLTIQKQTLLTLGSMLCECEKRHSTHFMPDVSMITSFKGDSMATRLAQRNGCCGRVTTMMSLKQPRSMMYMSSCSFCFTLSMKRGSSRRIITPINRWVYLCYRTMALL